MHYELLFLIAVDVLLCFCWMHFWWCGFVCAHALIDVDQGVGDEDKKKSCSKGRNLLLQQVSAICWEINYIMVFSCLPV